MKSVMAIFQLLFFFFELLTAANLELARDLLRRKLPFQTSIFAYPTQDLGPNEVFILLSFVSLTPGTLTMDHVDNVLYVHCLYGNREDAIRNQINRLVGLIKKIRPTEGQST